MLIDIMKIETLHPDDFEKVLQIWRDTGLYNPSSDSKDQFLVMLKKNPDTCITAKADKKIIGVLLGGYDGRRAYIHHLAVTPDFQRRGVGRLLVNYVITKFTGMQVPKVHFFIEKTNIDVVNFYRKLGAEVRDDLLMMSFVL